MLEGDRNPRGETERQGVRAREREREGPSAPSETETLLAKGDGGGRETVALCLILSNDSIP